MTENRDQRNDPRLLVLASLAEQPRHGYAIIQDVEAAMGVRVSSGPAVHGDRPA